MTTTAPEVDARLMLRVRLGDPPSVIEMLQNDALIDGHFELLHGGHSNTFIRFSRIVERPVALEATTQWLLPSAAAWLPEIVLAPATAGVALGWMLARRLGIPLLLADIDPQGRPTALREAGIIQNRRVLLVNDVVTTGRGMAALARVATDAGGTVAGGVWFLSRTDVNVADLIDAPVALVGDMPLAHWAPETCPQCSRGDALVTALEIN